MLFLLINNHSCSSDKTDWYFSNGIYDSFGHTIELIGILKIEYAIFNNICVL